MKKKICLKIKMEKLTGSLSLAATTGVFPFESQVTAFVISWIMLKIFEHSFILLTYHF